MNRDEINQIKLNGAMGIKFVNKKLKGSYIKNKNLI